MKKLDPKKYKRRLFLDYSGVILLVLLLLFIWQLYRGPIAMPVLKPYIIKALNHDDAEYQVTLDSVNLELVRSIKPIRIIASNVTYKKDDGSFTINAPKTSVSFSIKALLRGVIAPSTIEVQKPSVYIFTTYGVESDKQEEVTQKKLEYYFDAFEEFVERFNSDDKSYPESYINDISIKNAEVEFHEVDLGRKWAFSDLNYHFERNLTNIETDLNALVKIKNQIASIGLEAEYRPLKERLALQLYFADVVPSDIVENFATTDSLSDLYKVKLPINGKINALINFAEVLKNRDDIVQSLDTAVEKVQFQIEGGQGSILFSDQEDDEYKISAFFLEGDLTGGLDTVKIENAAFDLGGQKTKLSFYATGMKEYLLKNSLNNLKLTLKTQVAELKFVELPQYWPKYIATKAWDWCKESLLGGFAKNAEFEFDFAYDKQSKKFGFHNMKGKANIADGVLDYLTGMPKITGIYGAVNFYPDSIKIDVDKGVSNGVSVHGGYVRLYDLDKYDNFADIKLEASGTVTDVLKLIDNKPLGYTSEMGLNADKVSGNSETSLSLDFELKQNLTPEEVKVNVQSKITNFVFPDAIDGKPVKSPNLSLNVTNKGMLVEGDAFFEEIPLKLVWDESFVDKSYNSKYKLSFKFDEALKKKMGIDISAINPPFIDGYLDVDAYITTYDNDKMLIDINGNMKNARVDYSFLGLKKPMGESGNIKTQLEFIGKKLKKIPSFSLSKSDFSLQGRIDLDKNDKIKIVDIYDIKGPKTAAKAKIELANTPKQKVKINVSGSSYDLSAFFTRNDDIVKTKKKDKNTVIPENEEDELEKVTDTDIFIAVNSLWTNEKVAIKNFAGSAQLVNGIGIYEMHMIGNFDYNKKANLKLDYIPRSGNEFLLNISSNDAGNTMKFLRIYDNMRGGILSINAKRDKNKQFIGHAKIRDFSVHNTSVLTKLLSVASLSGMVNMITGEGMTFSHLDAPFEYKNKLLSTQDAKAFGNVMGITSNGSYSMRLEEFDVKGVIAPAYGLNTIIGKIPVVGNLLSGKDGTVFAANYSIQGDVDDPEIKINPLSALSPSSLKDLMSSIFGNENENK